MHIDFPEWLLYQSCLAFQKTKAHALRQEKKKKGQERENRQSRFLCLLPCSKGLWEERIASGLSGDLWSRRGWANCEEAFLGWAALDKSLCELKKGMHTQLHLALREGLCPYRLQQPVQWWGQKWWDPKTDRNSRTVQEWSSVVMLCESRKQCQSRSDLAFFPTPPKFSRQGFSV